MKSCLVTMLQMVVITRRRGVMITLYRVKPTLPHMDLLGDVCGVKGCVTGLAPETLSQPPELPRRLQKLSTGYCCWLFPRQAFHMSQPSLTSPPG